MMVTLGTPPSVVGENVGETVGLLEVCCITLLDASW